MNDREIHARKRCAAIMRHFEGQGLVVGVETGVFAGAFCSTLMPLYPNLWLYGVDPYCVFSMRDQWPQSRWDDLHDQVIRMMKPYEDRWSLIRLPALDAVDKLPDNLDFVYIDDDHSYEAVMAELPVYEKKIHPGGLFCGHDFNDAYPDVQRAVLEYTLKEGRYLNIDEDVSMWWWYV